MKLRQLLKKIDYTLIKGNVEIDVCDIAYDSRNVCNNYLFIALIGNNVDGHDYIDMAIEKGAKVIIVCKDIEIFDDITVIRVDNTDKVLSRLSMNFFDNPNEKLTTIAITGTKGKTTTSFMIKRIIEESGNSCGVIGTTGIYINDRVYTSINTTPISYDVVKYLREMVDLNIKYAVIEVSSQALKYDRVNDILFDYGIFTNLTSDHIGQFEHENMDDYINSKAKLFHQCIYGIFNIDDKYFNEMINEKILINTYGYSENADLTAKSIELYREDSNLGINLCLAGVLKDKLKIGTPGKFSSYNAMASVLTCYLLGIETKYMKKALCNFSVKGRVEPVFVSKDFSLLIDYAHNGVSTENVLTTIRAYNPCRIITIFGCGGNRSRGRRYEMGIVAGKFSDFCIITEDNNRFEEFDDIVSDILVGMNKTNCEYVIIADRRSAIKYAIEMGKSGDVIMLIGKGHEDYKEIKGIRYPFDERVIIREILDELNN
jgi:UDP-N-acetylmuramoyl-L-alanyl-D-glutamate--2,6-diaminopimelate ligase